MSQIPRQSLLPRQVVAQLPPARLPTTFADAVGAATGFIRQQQQRAKQTEAEERAEGSILGRNDRAVLVDRAANADIAYDESDESIHSISNQIIESEISNRGLTGFAATSYRDTNLHRINEALVHNRTISVQQRQQKGAITLTEALTSITSDDDVDGIVSQFDTNYSLSDSDLRSIYANAQAQAAATGNVEAVESLSSRVDPTVNLQNRSRLIQAQRSERQFTVNNLKGTLGAQSIAPTLDFINQRHPESDMEQVAREMYGQDAQVALNDKNLEYLKRLSDETEGFAPIYSNNIKESIKTVELNIIRESAAEMINDGNHEGAIDAINSSNISEVDKKNLLSDAQNRQTAFIRANQQENFETMMRTITLGLVDGESENQIAQTATKLRLAKEELTPSQANTVLTTLERQRVNIGGQEGFDRVSRVMVDKREVGDPKALNPADDKNMMRAMTSIVQTNPSTGAVEDIRQIPAIQAAIVNSRRSPKQLSDYVNNSFSGNSLDGIVNSAQLAFGLRRTHPQMFKQLTRSLDEDGQMKMNYLMYRLDKSMNIAQAATSDEAQNIARSQIQNLVKDLDNINFISATNDEINLFRFDKPRADESDIREYSNEIKKTILESDINAITWGGKLTASEKIEIEELTKFHYSITDYITNQDKRKKFIRKQVAQDMVYNHPAITWGDNIIRTDAKGKNFNPDLKLMARFELEEQFLLKNKSKFQDPDAPLTEEFGKIRTEGDLATWIDDVLSIGTPVWNEKKQVFNFIDEEGKFIRNQDDGEITFFEGKPNNDLTEVQRELFGQFPEIIRQRPQHRQAVEDARRQRAIQARESLQRFEESEERQKTKTLKELRGIARSIYSKQEFSDSDLTFMGEQRLNEIIEEARQEAREQRFIAEQQRLIGGQ